MASVSKNRNPVCQLALAGMIWACGGWSAMAAAITPNVVVIFTDDQGYADVGCFGAKGFETPHLDRMAAQGRKFTNFHVAQAVCSASRAALLTGCYPNRIGIHGALGPGSAVGISDEETTLAELFKSRGYATGMAGKWHLGDSPGFLPVRHGFDEYLGLPYSNDMWPLHPDFVKLPKNLAKRKSGFPNLPMIEGDRVVDAEVTGEDQAKLTTLYTERAVSFIERNKERPFFFYLAHSMPHVPLFVSEKFKGKSARGLYGDVIMEIDWSVGQVFDALERSGVADRTLVIFTSDNGPWLSYGDHAGSAGPLREGKGTSWEGGTRVSCIMRWPGTIPAGTECADYLMTIDLFPSLAAWIGAELPQHPIDGRDVRPFLTDQPGARNPHEAYWNYYASNELQAVTSGDGMWKLVLPHGYRTLGGRPGGKDGAPVDYATARVKEPELYQLAPDIGEARNVASQHPDIVSTLMVQAEKACAELGDSLTKTPGSGRRPPGHRNPGKQ